VNPAGFVAALAPRLTSLDAAPNPKYQVNRFSAVRRAEGSYARQLRKVARHVGEIVDAFDPGDPASVGHMNLALQRYAEAIRPWAQATAARMIAEVSRRDMYAWAEIASTMRRSLKEEILSAPTGELLMKRLADQVNLITSLPIEAARRVHRLTVEGMISGTRAKEIIPMIMESGRVTLSRAGTIARTEVARTASDLTQARAEHVGSETYTWLTARDGQVRPRHKKLEGHVFRWDTPPVIGERGERGNPGTIYECRCIAIPHVPDVIV